MENVENREIAVKLTGVKKRYRLGQIGGGSLRADLQSWWAKIRRKEDPNVRIGVDQRLIGQTFFALNGIDLTIYKGEAVGIIGGNGAGKSTMLKLLSRVTAPTEGEIDINGRIASMLEVGTGFHQEMTGRENVYLNGAILGMTKAEIDAKMDEIIEFSEVKDFIDTPVKRYSSGMFVKLAFSVAAHLDSEIMIMDEVLAVGDVNFQQKCLKKMREAAKEDGRTVLYVSHNMATIRQLCDRCIVLSQGRVIFEGDVETAIEIYSKRNEFEISTHTDLTQKRRDFGLSKNLFMSEVEILQSLEGRLKLCLRFEAKKAFDSVVLRMTVFDRRENALFTIHSDEIKHTTVGKNEVILDLDVSCLMNGKYVANLILSDFDEGVLYRHDAVLKGFAFEILDNGFAPYSMPWDAGWGLKMENIKVISGTTDKEEEIRG